jgi:large subunit ribosomal protein L5
MQTLDEMYKNDCIPLLMQEFKYKNINEVPKLEKIVLNMGLGEAIQNPKIIELAANELSIIAGQKPIITKAKKSIATFKLRKGVAIGCSVTLRKQRMYDFLTKFINIAVPRIRDFRGLPNKGFDGAGNYNLGIKEHIMFPEIDYDKIEKIKGMNITIVTTAKTDKESKFLLDTLGFPFRK